MPEPQGPPQPRPSGGNILTRKYTKLNMPGWAVLGLAAGGVFLYLRYKGKKASGDQTQCDPTSDPTCGATQLDTGEFQYPYTTPNAPPPNPAVPPPDPNPVPKGGTESLAPVPAGALLSRTKSARDPSGRYQNVPALAGTWVRCPRAQSSSGWCWRNTPLRGSYVRTVPYTVTAAPVPADNGIPQGG